ncbi:hemin uptake protein HemP [Hoeflea sp. G2-23]|uniref:Hemin uptake protein HemP n=1 Tax=Hoeflea algicola TaxID=2983763 RepID=A0ABT3ZDK2_9HYPH|nr:hemin uptake protein HemP [Hoeflea algicola]MCY0149874.1 hemin uptake protein HemP [Hoeflea algicola]
MRKTDSQSPPSPESDLSASPTPQSAMPEGDASAAVIASSALFGDRREISISHENLLYRLRITRQGKLILYK